MNRIEQVLVRAAAAAVLAVVAIGTAAIPASAANGIREGGNQNNGDQVTTGQLGGSRHSHQGQAGDRDSSMTSSQRQGTRRSHRSNGSTGYTHSSSSYSSNGNRGYTHSRSSYSSNGNTGYTHSRRSYGTSHSRSRYHSQAPSHASSMSRYYRTYPTSRYRYYTYDGGTYVYNRRTHQRTRLY